MLGFRTRKGKTRPDKTRLASEYDGKSVDDWRSAL